MRIQLTVTACLLLALAACGRGDYSKAIEPTSPPAPINPPDPGATNGGSNNNNGGTPPANNPGGGGGSGGSGGGSNTGPNPGGGSGGGGPSGGGGGQPVPEPSTLLLVGSGLAGLALMRRRRAERNAQA